MPSNAKVPPEFIDWLSGRSLTPITAPASGRPSAPSTRPESARVGFLRSRSAIGSPSPAVGTVTDSDSATNPRDAETSTWAFGAMLPSTNSPRASVSAWIEFGFLPYSAEVQWPSTLTPAAGLPDSSMTFPRTCAALRSRGGAKVCRSAPSWTWKSAQ